MAEDVKDGGQPDGTQGDPNSPGSTDVGVQQTGSSDAGELRSRLDVLERRLAESEARSKAAQGEKDRGWQKTSQEVGEIKDRLAQFEKLRSSGLEFDEAVAQMDKDVAENERFRNLEQRLEQAVSLLEAGTLETKAQQRAKVITEYGLDPKDPEVATIANGNPADFEGAIAKLAFKRQKEPAPTGAQAPAVQGGETKVGTKMRPEEAERLSVETKRLYDHYTKNRAQIEANETRLKEFWAQSEGGAP